MKQIKTIFPAVLAVLALLLPFAILVSAVIFTPNVYENTFTGALDEKFERLNSIEEEKIIVVGGSSVAFGIDSPMMEKYLGKPVVNFGLYAALGTKLMLDLSRSNIGEGDVVVLAPELDPQTLSMYFSSEHTLEALDGDYSMARYVRGDSKLSLLGGLWKHAGKKLDCLKNGAPNPEGVYNASSLNEYGDVKYEMRDGDGDLLWERRENVMQLYYDPSTVISLTEDIVSEDFVDYVNEYIKFCERRGATVYFSFCPINRAALADDTTGESLAAFEKYLKSKINCEFISYISSYVIEEGYFYDTNFHLNEAGVILRTKTLIEDIMIAEESYTAVDVEVPKAPALPLADVMFSGSDENDKYFTYETLANGALVITGLTDLGKTMEELTIPLGANNTKVTAIGAGAFKDSACKRVTVPEGSNLRNFISDCFKDSAVTDLYIYYNFTDEAEKLAPASDFGGITIHVPRGSKYPDHYDWNETSGGFTMVIMD